MLLPGWKSGSTWWVTSVLDCKSSEKDRFVACLVEICRSYTARSHVVTRTYRFPTEDEQIWSKRNTSQELASFKRVCLQIKYRGDFADPKWKTSFKTSLLTLSTEFLRNLKVWTSFSQNHVFQSFKTDRIEKYYILLSQQNSKKTVEKWPLHEKLNYSKNSQKLFKIWSNMNEFQFTLATEKILKRSLKINPLFPL